MDIEAAKLDVQTAIRRLPKQFLINMATEVERNKEILFATVPKIIDELKPHFLAAGMEAMMGSLDIPALEKAGMELLHDFMTVDMDDHNSARAEDHPDDANPEAP